MFIKKSIHIFLSVILILTFIFVMFNLNGCTNNQKVSCFGSKADIYLEKGKKLVTVTWRNNSLWIVTKPMKNTDSTEIYTVEEKSSLGVLEVYYTIHEVK